MSKSTKSETTATKEPTKRNRKPKAAASPELAPIGHNSAPADEDRRKLFISNLDKLERLIVTARSAAGSVRAMRKTMKGDGFHPTEIDYALYLRAKPEATVREEADARARVVRWLAHPVGYQPDMFQQEATNPAFEMGKKAGEEGKKNSPPVTLSAIAKKDWVSGWHEGQSVLASGFKETPTDAQQDVRPRFMQQTEDGDINGVPKGESVN